MPQGLDVSAVVEFEQALDARDRRHARLRERLLEATVRGNLLVTTEGEATGQINALSVVALREHAFGYPGRVTARASAAAFWYF